MSLPSTHLHKFVAVEQALDEHLCDICHLQGAHGIVRRTANILRHVGLPR